jgi:adenylate cyclase
MRRLLVNILDWLSNIGADPKDSDKEAVLKKIGVLAATASSLVLLCIGANYLIFNELAGWGYISYGLFMMLNVAALAIHRNLRLLTNILAPASLICQLIAVWMLGGFAHSSGVILWGLAYPAVGMIAYQGPRVARYWFAAFILNLILAIFINPWPRLSTNVPPLAESLILTVTIIGVAFLTFSVLSVFFEQRDHAYRMLRDEQGKSEKLLLNILPMEIAAILKNENRVIVDRYEGASVMFADIVNFTPMSVNMSPEDMMTLLNDIFSYFDRMVDKYGLEKIKTIGDCYMVASGVPRYRTDHAQAIVTMALEIQEYMRITPFHGRKISFRIGINSGTIVAGVIGQKKFAYDLWGDAVNTASRMESHGAEGMIQITRATYDLIQDEFDCKPKGIVNVKGKGEMEVWYVSSAHANRP